jgi:hypothetical protein
MLLTNIIIIDGVVGGRYSAAVPAAGTTDSLCLLFTFLCLQWQCMCLIVCMYGVQGIYGVQGVHMGRKLAMREPVDRRGNEQQKITRECQMHKKVAKKTQSHLMRFVDLIFLHLPW